MRLIRAAHVFHLFSSARSERDGSKGSCAYGFWLLLFVSSRHTWALTAKKARLVLISGFRALSFERSQKNPTGILVKL